MVTTFLNVKNNAASLLAADIAAGATELSVSTGDGSAKFPAATFHISIDNEIMLVTAKSTDVFTVTRAQESTSAAVHLAGAEVRLNITTKHITDLNEAVNFVEKYADYGLAFFGAVTTYTDTTHFKVSSLAGLGASTFLPAAGTPYEIYVFKADGAAPQGEQTPVVAYTTGDGTFQHAAFSVILAVGDEVLILHPLLASLGTKATAAAAGAVTTTDYMMAYVKQLVTQLLATDIVCDGIQTDLDNETDGLHRLLAWIQYFGDKLSAPENGLGAILNTVVYYGDKLDDAETGLTAIQNTVMAVGAYLASATFGLGVLKALIKTNAGLIGLKSATATADDLSDIATTDVSAKVRRLLLRFSSGAFSVSLDGSARTDLDALYTALGVLLGTRAVAAATGAVTESDSAMAYIKQLVTDLRTTLFQTKGQTYYGVVTTATSVTEFAATGLAGHLDDMFNGWWLYCKEADQAAPLGEWAIISNYASSGGVFTHSPFSAQLGVGDQVLIVHPMLHEALTIKGGPRSLETLGEDQDAGLDVARGTSGAVSVDGGEDNVYNESNDNEFVLLELKVDLNNMAEGDTIVFKVYTTEGGTERKISEDTANTFDGAQDPARAEIIGSGNQVWGREGIRVCAVKLQGTTRTVTAYYRDAKRGS